MAVIWLNDVEHGRRIADAAGCSFDIEKDAIISRVTEEGYLMGGFLYTGFTGAAIWIHMAGFAKNWCSRELLAVCFDYPFNQLKVDKVFGSVASTNQLAYDLDIRGGWKEVTRIPGVVYGGDMIVLSMSRPECKWLRLGARYLQRHGELAA